MMMLMASNASEVPDCRTWTRLDSPPVLLFNLGGNVYGATNIHKESYRNPDDGDSCTILSFSDTGKVLLQIIIDDDQTQIIKIEKEGGDGYEVFFDALLVEYMMGKEGELQDEHITAEIPFIIRDISSGKDLYRRSVVIEARKIDNFCPDQRRFQQDVV